jgi:ribokinase
MQPSRNRLAPQPRQRFAHGASSWQKERTTIPTSHIGVLASELARGRQLDEALPLANAAGALAVTHSGAHDALPTGAQIRAFLSERQRAETNNNGR